MKPISSHDPLDDLIAAALHGELTPEERAQFDSRLNTDPAARAAYQEAQAMHDLLEKTHQSAQPDSAFEQRMVSGVRRKLQTEQHRETAWESILVLWMALKQFPKRFRLVEVAVVLGIIAILAGVALGPITNGIKQAQRPVGVFSTINNKLGVASAGAPPTEDFTKTYLPPQPAATPDARLAVLDRKEARLHDQAQELILKTKMPSNYWHLSSLRRNG